MKTYSAKPATVPAAWYLLDASGKTLGRLATEVARRLRGKHKPEYTPHVDVGDYIIVVNAAQIRVTGKKMEQKKYYRHSGYPGGLKSVSYRKLHSEKPQRIIENAVKGMLPKGALGRQQFRKLRVYADDKHEHAAQQPQILEW